jgi:hypothetical protein
MWPFNPELQCPPIADVKQGREYTLLRLDCLIGWYARQSRISSVCHKFLRVVSISAAALITVLAAANYPSTYLAALGGVIVVAQGIDELYQFQTYWVKDAATKEELKREKALYLAKAGPYAPGNTDDPDRLLAEQTESVAGKELASWVQSQTSSSTGSNAR